MKRAGWRRRILRGTANALGTIRLLKITRRRGSSGPGAARHGMRAVIVHVARPERPRRDHRRTEQNRVTLGRCLPPRRSRRTDPIKSRFTRSPRAPSCEPRAFVRIPSPPPAMQIREIGIVRSIRSPFDGGARQSGRQAKPLSMPSSRERQHGLAPPARRPRSGARAPRRGSTKDPDSHGMKTMAPAPPRD